MNVATINIKKAEQFLSEYCPNNEALTDEIENWSKLGYSLAEVEEFLSKKMTELHEELTVDNVELLLPLRLSVECITFNKIHEFLMPLVYREMQNDDEFLFNKCKELCELEITAEQLGAPSNYAIPLSAAIVELASIDNHKSPIEKITCLSATYDFVYAELKEALADVISISSDKDNDIPIINNSDVIPILMTIITKSKLVHLYSNLYYVGKFLYSLHDIENMRHVMDAFTIAVERLMNLDNETLAPKCEKVCRSMNFAQLAKAMGSLESDLQHLLTPLNRHLQRTTDMIMASTSENND